MNQEVLSFFVFYGQPENRSLMEVHHPYALEDYSVFLRYRIVKGQVNLVDIIPILCINNFLCFFWWGVNLLVLCQNLNCVDSFFILVTQLTV